MMSDSSEQTISLEALYDTMSKEADGLYKQMITICTAFLGGTLVFFEKLFVSKAGWSIYFLWRVQVCNLNPEFPLAATNHSEFNLQD